MNVPGFIEPKNFELNGKTYILSKIPAVRGREIMAGYEEKISYKDGGYSASEAIMLKLMNYVAVVSSNGEPIRLINEPLINSHIPSTKDLLKVEREMLKYNFDFLDNGST